MGTTAHNETERFPSHGRCIYCDDAGTKLQDEHIVPLGLGGRHIINGASCASCAVQTSRVENTILRKLWGDARLAYDFPTRRRRKRPDRVVITGEDDADPVSYAKGEYPAPIWFYDMPRPGIIDGLPPDFDHSGYTWRIMAGMDARREKAWMAKYGAGFVGTISNCPREFARMYAKIAYCQVVSTLGLSGFRPFVEVRKFILEGVGNPSYWVGRSSDPMPRIEADYTLQTLLPDGLAAQPHRLVGGRVHLLPKADLPSYDVIVGLLL